jgi:hypothetical protein
VNVSAHGIEIDLPEGWEGRIYRRPGGWPILHAANFALPPEDGDFGTAAVGGMPPGGVFIALAEYHPSALGEPLFSRQGVPLPLRPSDVHPRALQRLGPGKAGLQRFFTSAGRPFCLHVVVESEAEGSAQVDEANVVLGSLRISTRPT